MKKNNDFLNQIKNILLKKAEGYFYNEEILEYASSEQTDNSIKKIKESGSLKPNLENLEVSSSKKSNKNENKKEQANLILSKKKITTHYIPPDIVAIKMLVEIFGQEVKTSDNLGSLSDEELYSLKDQILEQLLNFNNKEE